ncbi:hypothetical protein B566_EDAN006678 [Ephemera danica]|nr:hypothetical protein B566_EDAN006678 [Ephemera danica]
MYGTRSAEYLMSTWDTNLSCCGFVAGQFQTDGQKVAGTQCDYVFISSNYSLSSGRFFSPRFPSSYPRGASCNFRFRARPKERVRIVFEEVALQKGDVR